VLKQLRYLLETVFVLFGLIIFRLFPVNFIGNIAGKIAIFIGKKLKVHQLANKNLSLAFVGCNQNFKQQTLTKMWFNLGKIIAEFIHIATMSGKKLSKFVEINQETAQQIAIFKQQTTGGIIFSAHFGNWEIGPKTLLNQGLKVHTVYRPLNNRYVEFITAWLRGVSLIKKGTQGNRQIINAIKKGEWVIILADQKITDGIEVDFFNQPAITSASLAKIALKYQIPLVLGYILRKNEEFSFSLHLKKPLQTENLQNTEQNIKKLTLQINQNLENIISKNPEQWFWVHNRWKK
jgi:KDO2-lipid IV(A) lauroyltransferase